MKALLLELGGRINYILKVVFLNISILFSGYFNQMKTYMVIQFLKKKSSLKEGGETEVFMANGKSYNYLENRFKF